MPARVLIADDDPTIREVLKRILAKGGFDIQVVPDGERALQILDSDQAPTIALLDWMMPGLDGIEVCRQARRARGAQTYIYLLSGRQREDDILAAFDAGADEFIGKPFDTQTVLARIQATDRRLQAGSTSGATRIMAVLQEASRGATGEVIVRNPQQVGRVLYHRGRVIWVQLSGGAPVQTLLAELGVTSRDAQAVLEECRKRRLPFNDTLVSWGLVEPEALRRRFLIEFTRRLESILALPAALAFFAPTTHSFESGFSYALDEFELSPRPSGENARTSDTKPRPITQPPPPGWHTLLDEVRDFEGMRSVAIVEADSHLVRLSAGQPVREDLVRHLARVVDLEGGESFDDLLLSSASSYHLMRRVAGGVLLYVCVDRAQNPNVALVRIRMSQMQLR